MQNPNNHMKVQKFFFIIINNFLAICANICFMGDEIVR